MLRELTIKNFAIIDNLNIFLDKGLTVLTGETGAGKSIIIEALDFLMGSRAQTELIKTGTLKAVVEGTFSLLSKKELNWLIQNEFEIKEDENLVISRELTRDGSKARINGLIANISHLNSLKEELLSTHEQNEHAEFLKPESQLDIIDNYGDRTHKEAVCEFKDTYHKYESLKSELEKLMENQEAITRKISLLEGEKKEISLAKIKNTNEDTDLQKKREILVNKKELVETVSQIYELTGGENPNNVLANLSSIKKLVTRCTRYDKNFESYLKQLEDTILALKELSSFAYNYLENMDHDETSLNKIEERIDNLNLLKKKYGKTLEDILSYLNKIECELNSLQNTKTSQSDLETKLHDLGSKITLQAEKITKSREKIIKVFVNEINNELQELGFKHVLFVVELTECNLYEGGKEKIQFLFTSNPDEPPKPLSKIASGGELSRVMLAIKSKGVPWYAPTTMIFDEIDLGVSGEIAANVAKKIYKISKNNQVVCITHNPIIASMADMHLVVEKRIEDGTTKISVKEVTQDDKVEAIATLLTPDKKSREGITSDAIEFAKSLLENAKKIKEVTKHQAVLVQDTFV